MRNYKTGMELIDHIYRHIDFIFNFLLSFLHPNKDKQLRVNSSFAHNSQFKLSVDFKLAGEKWLFLITQK